MDRPRPRRRIETTSCDLSVPDVVVSLLAPFSLPPRLFTLSYDQFIPLSTDSITPTCKFTLVHRPVPQH